MIRIFLFVFISVITGCNSDKQISETPSESDVIAVVGGVNILPNDLRTASLRSLRKEYSELPEEVQGRLLDSVISTLAMSQIAQSQAHIDKQKLVESSVSAYRDELWVKEYLKENASPQPVSNQQIEEYYNAHPEYFGGGSVVEYTHINCQYSEKVKVKDCTKLLAGNNTEKWFEAAKEHQSITVFKASFNSLIEKNELSQLILSTKEQGYSGLKNSSTHLHRIFVIKVRELPPKPLVTVQRNIRERLAPIQLKRAIKAASEQATKRVTITRPAL